jgi:hypothetical protein
MQLITPRPTILVSATNYHHRVECEMDWLPRPRADKAIFFSRSNRSELASPHRVIEPSCQIPTLTSLSRDRSRHRLGVNPPGYNRAIAAAWKDPDLLSYSGHERRAPSLRLSILSRGALSAVMIKARKCCFDGHIAAAAR